MANGVQPIPDGYTAVTPYLMVDGAAAAIDFYTRAFGAEEVMRMPAPEGDRLMHAEIRRRLRTSGQWDEAMYGVPVSAANMALASANFSASSIRDMDRLGAHLDADARAGIMQIWRCASWLMGTPEALLFDGDEAETAEFLRIAHLCEPPAGQEAVQTSNALIYLLPEGARLTDRSARRSMVEHAYGVSRALIGDELADRLRFPAPATDGGALQYNVEPFRLLLDSAMLEDLRSRLPDQAEPGSTGPSKRG